MRFLLNWFVKITGWIPQRIAFKTKVFYEDKKVQSRRIKGSAIIISNHTSVYDYAVFLFVFMSRTLRYLIAEVIFEKKLLGWFLKALGGIRVDRNSFDFGFIEKSRKILDKGGVVGIFPEARLPKKDEERPLEFKPSAAYLALYADVPIIPVYTNGEYFHGKKAKVVIGKPIDVKELYDDSKSEKENLAYISECLRQKVIDLGGLINGK